MSAIFTISLDFELHWGGFEKWPLQTSEIRQKRYKPYSYYNQYFLNTRKVIPQMLALFEKYEVHVTWASVGMLLHDSKKSLLQNSPQHRPSYNVSELSAYHYIETVGIGEDEENDPFHFAPSLIKKIIETPHQELGTHTFAHYYCNEDGQTVQQFREDLQAAQRIAKRYGVHLQSLVFPRNQFNDDYLKVCFEEGITSVRSNPLDWFWEIKSTQKESAWKRLNRGLDAYFPVGKKNTYNLKEVSVREGFPVCLPASRLLRPYRPSELFLNDLKVKRIKFEMLSAAKSDEVYHLWWHPHNFGNFPKESLEALEDILIHFAVCKKQHGMKSLNMCELATLLK